LGDKATVLEGLRQLPPSRGQAYSPPLGAGALSAPPDRCPIDFASAVASMRRAPYGSALLRQHPAPHSGFLELPERLIAGASLAIALATAF